MPDPRAAHAVQLEAEDDVAGFRRAARRLVAQRVPPDQVSWFVSSAAESDLFGAVAGGDEALADDAPALMLPGFFAAECQHAALHADPARFGLLYRLAWRLLHEPGLRHDPLDADRIAIAQMARAVRRDMHKMTAFVRFRPLSAPTDDGWGVTHVAWFEPLHHTVRATAPFFVRRFAQMPWAILTPERSARWDGHRLAFGPGARREDAPGADAGEQLWLTYYENIFNPARLKLKMMQKEMPRHYWKNLPEAVLIQPLTAASAARSGQMVAQGGTEPARRRPAASIALRLDAPQWSSTADAVPATLAALHAATERCRACPIGQHATQAVPGVGPEGAQCMVVGEQPGDQEDLRGQPFVGPAGQLLNRAMAQLGWPRESVYLTNAVKHFKFEPRGKRRIHKTPAQQEAMACAHWLEGEIALVRPKALVALGATAARALLGRPVAVTAERGQWLMRPDGLPVLVTLHPAALLRMPQQQFDAAFGDWLADLGLAAAAQLAEAR
ncbi:MAG: uracil-DNA glycosylase [Rhodoferax sp.]|nr:uracil-DNA glycosylase [Rhodoferax sp.]